MVSAPSNRFAAIMRALTGRHHNGALKSDRIRLVVNALHAKSGGGVTYLRNLLPLLADDPRFEVHVFLHRDQMELFHPIDERVNLHLFSFPKGLVRLMLWEQLVIPMMVRIMAADVVFSPANFGSLFVRDQVILLRNALAVAKTETRLSKRFYWAALGVITFLSLLRCRRALAVSDYAARSLSLGMRSWFQSKVRIVHHGVNRRFAPNPQVRRQDFLLAVSDIYVQKNLHNLFRAMRAVCDRHPNIRLKIAGQKIDSWYYDAGIQLIQQLGIAENVEFLGRLPAEKLLSLYQNCAALVFPSTAETFGMPLVEAMACGTPIISSNSTAMPEIVGDAAVLFDPLNVESMASAINRVLGDADLRADLSRRALERASSFSWQKTATATGDILAEAASRHR